MTKMRLREADDPKATIDRFRTELQTEYFDILLLHCVRVPDWARQYERGRDALSEAKVGHIERVRAKGTGVIGMKIMGEGQFKTHEQRDASIRFVTRLGTVDAITIGYRSEAEIDEAIERLDTHLSA